MQKWEYLRVTDVQMFGNQKYLKDYEAEGWELVETIPDEDYQDGKSEVTFGDTYVLRRPIE